MINKDIACCFTGHRIIAQKYRELLPEKLEHLIRRLIGEGIADFISGGALGFDTLAAEAVLRLRKEFPHIRLILALPCREQSKGWLPADKARYQKICQEADLIHYTAEQYSPTCMMQRNRFMVENSTACVFFLLNQRSGTYKTVSYALDQNRNLYNILSEE